MASRFIYSPRIKPLPKAGLAAIAIVMIFFVRGEARATLTEPAVEIINPNDDTKTLCVASRDTLTATFLIRPWDHNDVLRALPGVARLLKVVTFTQPPRFLCVNNFESGEIDRWSVTK